MKTHINQIYHDETLMEFADQTLPRDEMKKIARTIKESECDKKIVDDFDISLEIINLLRAYPDNKSNLKPQDTRE